MTREFAVMPEQQVETFGQLEKALAHWHQLKYQRTEAEAQARFADQGGRDHE